jgi:hypothetical protein
MMLQKRSSRCVRHLCCTVLYLLIVVAGVALAAVNYELITQVVVGYINVDIVGELADMRRELTHLKEALAVKMNNERRKTTKPVEEFNSTSFSCILYFLFYEAFLYNDCVALTVRRGFLFSSTYIRNFLRQIGNCTFS